MMALRRLLPSRMRCEGVSSSWRALAILVGVNQAVALLLTSMGGHATLLDNALIANAIGISIWTLHSLSARWLPPGQTQPWRFVWLRALIAVPLGVWFGFKVSAWLGAYDLFARPDSVFGAWRVIASSLLLAGGATMVVVLYIRNLQYQTDLAAEQRRVAEARQTETAAQLALLQAQIEPHFLFNTLANVHSLIVQDPPLAQTMLDHLNSYLRVSLGRTRRLRATLGDELQLVGALLAIAQIRLPARLGYRIEVPAVLQGAVLPPLLLQPLVENALRHGIEAAVAGGEVTVRGERVGDGRLRLTVSDTGPGLAATPATGLPTTSGIGLANVRQRLASLYGEHARLALYPNVPHGVVAELLLPYEESA
ncbi:histidine kinase [Chitiniphilus purpureus]|uniref:Histidine kinase n=1 Tax=Chitiniphilus purpureus TaxID=2981137 RepID=A0ABY6DQM1_9NEIS|nr:histidine kinase [Chitiniphilus sp. CD1]UXY16612.1 histidine kinase [Chitiniphilus sp. CD1]